jgi:hypothetical protein
VSWSSFVGTLLATTLLTAHPNWSDGENILISNAASPCSNPQGGNQELEVRAQVPRSHGSTT